MELDLHQLEVRYEGLRVRRPEHERRLLSSLADHGQQVPIVVIAAADPGRFVVVDGHKRVRALRRLRCDTVEATVWPMSEVDALVLSRSLRQAEAETALEQGWLLCELHRGLGMDIQDLARRFDRSVSWVSRRLGLVEQLPESVQERVRQGEIGAHAAMKHLVPMARANREACEALAAAIATHKLSTHDVGELYTAWRDGAPSLRARVLTDPLLFLKARREVQSEPLPSASPTEGLLKDLDLIGAIARRALRRHGAAAGTLLGEGRDQVARAAEQALADVVRLQKRISNEKEEATNARAKPAYGGSGVAPATGRCPPDRSDSEDLASGGAARDRQPMHRPTNDAPSGESRTLPQGDPRASRLLSGQPGPSP